MGHDHESAPSSAGSSHSSDIDEDGTAVSTSSEEDEDDATGGPEGEILPPESLLRLLPMTFKLKVLPNSASLAFCI